MIKAKIVIFNSRPDAGIIPENDYIKKHIDLINAPSYKLMSAFSYKLLGQMLKDEFNTDLSKLVICENEKGKPYFENSKICFNISHTDNALACIISDKPVGIDIETVKEHSNNLLLYCTSEDERQYIRNECDFVKLWTLKESYVKAIGTGLSYGLKNLKFNNFLNPADRISMFDNNKPVKNFFYSKNFENYVFSICSEAEISESDIIINKE